MSRAFLTPVVLCLFCVWALPAAPQRPPARTDETENPLAGKPEAIEAGKKLFAAACVACHGANGEGGRGPKLTERRGRRGGDEELFRTIQKGVAGSDMPPFNLPEENIWQLAAYVRSLSAPAFETNVPGDAEAGSAIFYTKGRCTSCHMIRGRGGHLGPDLSNIGMARPYRQLKEALLEPSARLAQGFQGVTVTTGDGRKIDGVAKNNTSYSIQVLDAKGELHLLEKKDLREVVFHTQSLMPGDYGKRLTVAEVENVLAFLSRQSLRPLGATTSARRNP